MLLIVDNSPNHPTEELVERGKGHGQFKITYYPEKLQV